MAWLGSQGLRVKDLIDKQLFFSSIVIQIDNGKSTPFWEGRWLHGIAPTNLASNLFQVVRFKFRSVYAELQNDNWIRNLRVVNEPTQIEEFTLLVMALAEVTLNNQCDEITWKWTPYGQFSIASAYNCQFLGSVTRLQLFGGHMLDLNADLLDGWSCTTRS
jgi:hypothetical protein